MLAGEFTRNALHQLESKGFGFLHIPYDSILAAFRELGIDASSEDGVTELADGAVVVAHTRRPVGFADGFEVQLGVESVG